MSLPALPLVQGAVLALAPRLDNGLTAELMNQICGLARGDLSQDQVNQFLADRRLDAAPGQDRNPALVLLKNGDRAGQATLCAAYLAGSVFSTADLQPFLEASAGTTHAADGKANQPEATASQDSVTMLLSVRLAVARANADVFALIASEMQRRPGLTPLEVREQVQQLFSRLAPTYLARIRARFQAPGTVLQQIRLDKETLVFSSSDGADFVLERGQLRLRQDGVMIYGDGRLHGLIRTLQVAYFDAQAAALLTSSDMAVPDN
ncbi:hypothetical protein [Pseudomonas sp. PDM20]|uniref:hypothetical protein n=1 Tax=Pseudomonas sp. PDM20 TaxID=2769254 RepID=UPI003D02B091